MMGFASLYPSYERVRRRDIRRAVLCGEDRAKQILGLFAVGNDAASIFGGSYPGTGATLGPAMTFGYICGKNFAESLEAESENSFTPFGEAHQS